MATRELTLRSSNTFIICKDLSNNLYLTLVYGGSSLNYPGNCIPKGSFGKNFFKKKRCFSLAKVGPYWEYAR